MIGNHTYTHCNLSKLETGEAKKELEQTDTVIEKITGKQPVFVRAPYGELPGGQRTRSEQNIYRMDGGSAGLDDRRYRGGCKNSCGRDKSGRCYFLLHDCYPSSVQAAIRIVDLLQGKGYEFVTVDHLIMD